MIDGLKPSLHDAHPDWDSVCFRVHLLGSKFEFESEFRAYRYNMLNLHEENG